MTHYGNPIRLVLLGENLGEAPSEMPESRDGGFYAGIIYLPNGLVLAPALLNSIDYDAFYSGFEDGEYDRFDLYFVREEQARKIGNAPEVPFTVEQIEEVKSRLN